MYTRCSCTHSVLKRMKRKIEFTFCGKVPSCPVMKSLLKTGRMTHVCLSWKFLEKRAVLFHNVKGSGP